MRVADGAVGAELQSHAQRDVAPAAPFVTGLIAVDVAAHLLPTLLIASAGSRSAWRMLTTPRRPGRRCT